MVCQLVVGKKRERESVNSICVSMQQKRTFETVSNMQNRYVFYMHICKSKLVIDNTFGKTLTNGCQLTCLA